MADKPKVKPVCKACGSDELSCDATARWDIDTQNWELSETFDSKTCDQCGYEKDYCDWINIDDEGSTDSGTLRVEQSECGEETGTQANAGEVS